MPVEAWFSGCAAVLAGPTCVPPTDRKVRVWVPDGDHRVSFDGGAASDPVAVGGGRRFEVVLDADASRLQVGIGSEPPGAWTLALTSQPALPALEQAAAARKAGQPEAAERGLREALTKADPASRARLTSALARVVLPRDAEAALLMLDEAAALHAGLGRLSDWSDDLHAAAYLRASQLRQFPAARTTLGRPRPAPGDYPDGAVRQAFYSALLAKNTGDLRQALASLREAQALADRVGLQRQSVMAAIVTSTALLGLGRVDEAVTTLVGLEARLTPEREACDRASVLNNLGWSVLLEAESGRPARPPPAPATWVAGRRSGAATPPAGPAPRPEPEALLREALALYRGPCADPAKAALTELHLALAALGRGDLQTTRDRLEALGGGAPRSPDVEHWRLLTEGRLALGEGRPDLALAHFQRLAARADASIAPEAAWRASVGVGRAEAALGRADAAIESWRRAESMLDDRTLLMPLSEGRETFVGEREMGARLLVDALVAANRPEEALSAARRSRARILAGVQRVDRLGRLTAEEQGRWDTAVARYEAARAAIERDAAGDWQLADDALAVARTRREAERAGLREALDEAFAVLGTAEPAARPPLALADGELALLYHPGADGWLGFAATRAQVVARRLPGAPTAADPPARLATVLLEPFADVITPARRLRLLPYGPLRALDLHTLPFRDVPLSEHAPVVYGLDLRDAPASAAPSKTALVVADPRGDLPAARTEAEQVTKALSGGLQVRTLRGADATASALRSALAEVDLLHYAGHGRFGGRGGWESELPLAAGGALTVGDVLALPGVPRVVVLSGCETARAADEAPAEAVGLAQGFVAAGSSIAIAAARPVDDADTALLMAALYPALTGGDPASALRDAQRALRAARPGSDWGAFRILVP